MTLAGCPEREVRGRGWGRALAPYGCHDNISVWFSFRSQNLPRGSIIYSTAYTGRQMLKVFTLPTCSPTYSGWREALKHGHSHLVLVSSFLGVGGTTAIPGPLCFLFSCHTILHLSLPNTVQTHQSPQTGRGLGQTLESLGPYPWLTFQVLCSPPRHIKSSVSSHIVSPHCLLLVADIYTEASVHHTHKWRTAAFPGIFWDFFPKTFLFPPFHSEQAMPNAHPYGHHLLSNPVL